MLLSIWLLVLSLPVYSYGLSDYSAYTPGGNTITDNGGGSFLELKNHTTIEYLHEWYFYHDCIIGKYSKSSSDTTFLFVLDEKSGDIKTFYRETEWRNYLQQKNLVPVFWTRWYGHDWTRGLVFFLFLYSILFFFILLPIEIILFIFFFHKMIQEGFSFRKPYSLTCYIFGLVILIDIILGAYPQSL